MSVLFYRSMKQGVFTIVGRNITGITDLGRAVDIVDADVFTSTLDAEGDA
jgi:predicted ABC-class ATPase